MIVLRFDHPSWVSLLLRRAVVSYARLLRLQAAAAAGTVMRWPMFSANAAAFVFLFANQLRCAT